MTFAELEDECIEVGDLLAAGVLQERVAERSTPEELPSCLVCGRQCVPLADDEARVLQTDRGEVLQTRPGDPTLQASSGKPDTAFGGRSLRY